MQVNFPENLKGVWMVDERYIRKSGKPTFRVKDNIASIKVTARNAATGADNKLGRAASGAILGFLIAGPLGTMVGASAGASSGKAAKNETFNVTITFPDFKFLIGTVDEYELETFRSNIKE